MRFRDLKRLCCKYVILHHPGISNMAIGAGVGHTVYFTPSQVARNKLFFHPLWKC